MMKAQKVFSGFEEDNFPTIAIPRLFIEELMQDIDDVNEFKVILTIFRYFQFQDGSVKFIRLNDLYQDANLLNGLVGDPADKTSLIAHEVRKLAERGILILGAFQDHEDEETPIFLNTPLGQASAQALSKGHWKINPPNQPAIHPPPILPNIFKLYEQHIGPLTPMIVETLEDAEQTYPLNWIEEAVRLAVENNKRSWRYVEAILRRWKEEGKGERKTRQDTEETLRKYAEQWKRPIPTRRKR